MPGEGETPAGWTSVRKMSSGDPDELLELAADRKPVVVLTALWHERDTPSLVERLGVPVFVPPPETADDLVRK